MELRPDFAMRVALTFVFVSGAGLAFGPSANATFSRPKAGPVTAPSARPQAPLIEPLEISRRHQRINDAYIAKIKPVFSSKCFDCHSGETHFPFYYKFPGVRWWIDRDIREARADFELGKDFPFTNKRESTPRELLRELREVIDEDSMPPAIYRIVHSGSGLTTPEKKAILEWIAWAEHEIGSAP